MGDEGPDLSRRASGAVKHAPRSGKWTPIRAIVRSAQIAREDGFRALWFRVLSKTVYHRLHLLETELYALTEVAPPAGVVLGPLEPVELDDYLRLRPQTDADSLAARFERGDRCFVAREGGRAIAATWFTDKNVSFARLGWDLHLKEDEGYMYDTFTAPEARGRGLAPALMTYVAKRCRRDGYRRIVVAISPENRASLRARGKTGARISATIGCVRFGPWRHHFIRRAPRKSR